MADDGGCTASTKGGWILSQRQVEIVNPLGLHMRAADKFASVALRFRSDVHVWSDGMKVNGKSILDLIGLAAECGSLLAIEAVGPDADAALAELSELVAAHFHE